VNPGDTVVDVGANYGMYAYPLSRAVGATGTVWAFEPIPFTIRTLTTVVKLLRLGNVRVVPKGVSDHAGTAVFDVPLQDNGAPSAGQAHSAERDDDRPGREQHAKWGQSTEVTCELVTLDECLDSCSNVSLIKADIEGGELLALQGAERLLGEHHPTVICEINPWFLEGLGLTASDLTGFLGERGYSIYRYVDGRLRPPAAIEEDNYVFVHPARRGALAHLIDEASAG
jgi:FkbM family methyltransferase